MNSFEGYHPVQAGPRGWNSFIEVGAWVSVFSVFSF